MKFFPTLLLASLLLAGATAIHAAETVEITEWPVPWENSRPRDPYVDNQNRVWFVGQVGNYLAYLDPRTGKFKRYELDEGTGPHNLIVDNDGVRVVRPGTWLPMSAGSIPAPARS